MKARPFIIYSCLVVRHILNKLWFHFRGVLFLDQLLFVAACSGSWGNEIIYLFHPSVLRRIITWTCVCVRVCGFLCVQVMQEEFNHAVPNRNRVAAPQSAKTRGANTPGRAAKTALRCKTFRNLCCFYLSRAFQQSSVKVKSQIKSVFSEMHTHSFRVDCFRHLRELRLDGWIQFVLM